MNKQEYLLQLREGLAGLPKREVEERLTFYSEMIDEQVAEGMSEEEAVASIGTVNEIVCQIADDLPADQAAVQITKAKGRMGPWGIVLLILGSPVWVSLLIAAFAVIFSVWVSLWSVIISFWAVFGSLGACAVGTVAAGVIFTVFGKGLTGAAMLSAAFVCAGLCIFAFFGCKEATRGAVWLTKKIARGMKICFTGKEKHQ